MDKSRLIVLICLYQYVRDNPSKRKGLFVDHLCYLCLVFVMLSRLFIAGWERVDLLALVCDV